MEVRDQEPKLWRETIVHPAVFTEVLLHGRAHCVSVQEEEGQTLRLWELKGGDSLMAAGLEWSPDHKGV